MLKRLKDILSTIGTFAILFSIIALILDILCFAIPDSVWLFDKISLKEVIILLSALFIVLKWFLFGPYIENPNNK